MAFQATFKDVLVRSVVLNAPTSVLLLPVFPYLPNVFVFYRAMHFSAKRGIAIACRLSVRPSVTLVNCDHISGKSSKIISPSVSLACSLFATQT